MPLRAVTSAKNPRTVSVSTRGKRWRPTRATASDRMVTAFSSCSIEPCPGRERTRSFIQAIDFSPVMTG